MRSSTVALDVDHLTRLAGVKPAEIEVLRTIAELFRVSFAGATTISDNSAYASVRADVEEAVSWIDVLVQEYGIACVDINENAMRAACRLATYVVGKRADVRFYNSATSRLVLDDTTVSQIMRVVLRLVRSFVEHGPNISNGFAFADPQKYSMGDRDRYTVLVASGDGEFLIPYTSGTSRSQRPSRTRTTRCRC
ncbi:hypothetical protein [Mycetocola saprophilus]|uniref:hypothetical protein n=1 Tax=Mycetocola saprophilus TaxID=76636 RepID=UPI003BF399D3